MAWLTASMSAPARSRMSAQRSITASRQFQQHGLAIGAGRDAARQLVLDQHEWFRRIVTHRNEAMIGEDEGHRRNPRRLVSAAHIRLAVM